MHRFQVLLQLVDLGLIRLDGGSGLDQIGQGPVHFCPQLPEGSHLGLDVDFFRTAGRCRLGGVLCLPDQGRTAKNCRGHQHG